ncbi:hypothetical protein CONPUDRAFT_155803 [Coniophora puteana RWD-64-598 SS2]|uniref:Uncharacterized protein n=1 Tax=Coniophora puteana (strain RWD-64-598) TaxID=741705 RepID=A0A5M3MIP7_CONPW|nr:uncharacterized protein CONPUDRAFT_155803 [Coniophora puteana RWD-64-598 SS2]EIW79118.1 hypothetical protein CONPUDRAFT_155803 [Coniophora puteana RWD-64-598 SS2]
MNNSVVEQPNLAEPAGTEAAGTHDAVAPPHDAAPTRDATPTHDATPNDAVTLAQDTVATSNTASTGDAAPIHDVSAPDEMLQRHPADPLFYVETLHKGWVQGHVLSFMEGHIEGYCTARSQSNSRVHDCVDTVTNEFFNFVPWCNKMSDPVPDNFNPHAVEDLSKVEEDQKAHKIEAVKTSITAWLDCRINSTKLVGWPGSKENDVWTRLLKQLSGVPSVKPKKLSAMQFWLKLHYASIVKADCDARWDAEKGRLAEQLSCEAKAKEDHKHKVAKWKASLNAPIDTSPEGRQSVIDTLQTFISPILDEVHEATGLHLALFLAGPKPRKGGCLNCIVMHRGETVSASPQHRAAAQPQTHKAAMKVFLDFVGTCFTKEMKAQSALKKADESAPEGSSSDLLGTGKPGNQIPNHEASGSSTVPHSVALSPSCAAPLPRPSHTPSQNATPGVSCDNRYY